MESENARQNDAHARTDVIWAQLVSTNAFACPSFDITRKDEFSIGRARNNEVVVRDTRVSKVHCRVRYFVQGATRQYTITNQSKNALRLNHDQVLTQGQTCALQDKDVIVLAVDTTAGARLDQNAIGFVFRDLSEHAEVLAAHKAVYARSEVFDYRYGAVDRVSPALKDKVTCAICLGTFKNCYTLTPCLDTFCAGCSSEIVIKNKTCPQCNERVEKAIRNDFVNYLAEAYTAEFMRDQGRAAADEQDEEEEEEQDFFRRDVIEFEQPRSAKKESARDQNTQNREPDSPSNINREDDDISA